MFPQNVRLIIDWRLRNRCVSSALYMSQRSYSLVPFISRSFFQPSTVSVSAVPLSPARVFFTVSCLHWYLLIQLFEPVKLTTSKWLEICKAFSLMIVPSMEMSLYMLAGTCGKRRFQFQQWWMFLQFLLLGVRPVRDVAFFKLLHGFWQFLMQALVVLTAIPGQHVTQYLHHLSSLTANYLHFLLSIFHPLLWKYT